MDEDRRLVKVNETVAEDASEEIGLVVSEEPDKDPVTVVYDFRGATMLERHGIDEAAKWLMYKRILDEMEEKYSLVQPATYVPNSKVECPDCNGRGKIELFTSWAECDECDGTGRV